MAEEIKFDLAVGKDSLNPALEKAQGGASKLSSTLAVAAGSFAAGVALRGLDAITSAMGSLVGVVFEGIEAASQQEQATQDLNTALALSGQYSEETAKSFQELASEIQNTTKLEDDAVLSTAALIQQLGKLDGEALEGATRAAVDLSAALGIDLNSAATLVGKAATGNVTAFGKLGVEIRKGSTDAETFSNALNKISASFGGAAASQAKTFSGAFTQLKNAIGDSKEELGNIVTTNTAFVAAIKTAQSVVVQLTESFKNAFGGDNSERTAEFIKSIIDGANFIVLSLDAVVRALDGMANLGVLAFETLALGIQAPTAGILKLASSIPLIGDSFKAMSDESTAEMERLAKVVEDRFNALGDFASKDTFLSGVSQGLADAKVQFDVFFDEIKKKGDSVKNATTIAGGGGEVDQSILDARTTLSAEIKALEAQEFEERLRAREEMNIALAQADGAYREQELINLADFQLRKNEIEYQAALDKAELIKDPAGQELAKEKALREKQLKDLQANNKKQLDTQRLLAQEEQTIFNSRIAAFQGFASLGGALAKQNSNEAKLLSSTNALISTYAGAAQVLGDPKIPTLAKPAFVAGIIAQGLAQVANINKQSFAVGGIVGATAGGDNTTANVREGEMVLTADQQKNLFDTIKSGNMGGPIIIQIDGREVFKAVRAQMEQGMRLPA